MLGLRGYIGDALSGITALMALGILEQVQEQGLSKNLLEMEHNSVEYLHALVEALRSVFFVSTTTRRIIILFF